MFLVYGFLILCVVMFLISVGPVGWIILGVFVVLGGVGVGAAIFGGGGGTGSSDFRNDRNI